MRVALVINRAARAGAPSTVPGAVADLLREAGIEVAVHHPTDAASTAGAIIDLVAGRPDAVLVAGGDGTMGAALAVVAGTGIPLGLVPTGTGNDLARDLGVPVLDARAAAAAVIEGRRRSIDLARVRIEGSERVYSTVFACGFDSRVNERANRMRWPRGPLRYTLAVLIEFVALRATRMRLTMESADGSTRIIDEELLVAAVGNTASYGGGIPICPGARIDDGLLEVTLVRRAGRLRLLGVLRRVYAGTHGASAFVEMHRVRAITLRGAGLIGYADGERVGPLPARIEAAPAAAVVLTPR